MKNGSVLFPNSPIVKLVLACQPQTESGTRGWAKLVFGYARGQAAEGVPLLEIGHRYYDLSASVALFEIPDGCRDLT
jgi:hypothetical protein